MHHRLMTHKILSSVRPLNLKDTNRLCECESYTNRYTCYTYIITYILLIGYIYVYLHMCMRAHSEFLSRTHTITQCTLQCDFHLLESRAGASHYAITVCFFFGFIGQVKSYTYIHTYFVGSACFCACLLACLPACLLAFFFFFFFHMIYKTHKGRKTVLISQGLLTVALILSCFLLPLLPSVFLCACEPPVGATSPLQPS